MRKSCPASFTSSSKCKGNAVLSTLSPRSLRVPNTDCTVGVVTFPNGFLKLSWFHGRCFTVKHHMRCTLPTVLLSLFSDSARAALILTQSHMSTFHLANLYTNVFGIISVIERGGINPVGNPPY
ncbi:hypothetical protein TNCV_3589911 [Trichonephila clavipes]|nr:hypothetical protein TNCV_3589911 [Trichonephila clavipes]